MDKQIDMADLDKFVDAIGEKPSDQRYMPN